MLFIEANHHEIYQPDLPTTTDILRAYESLLFLSLHYKFDKTNTFIFEPQREKTGLRGFRPGPTQTDLYSHRSRLEA